MTAASSRGGSRAALLLPSSFDDHRALFSIRTSSFDDHRALFSVRTSSFDDHRVLFSVRT